MGACMGSKAVAVYLLELIEAQPDLKIATVQDAAGVRSNYLWRLANEDNVDLKARTIGALVRATRGHIETAMDLLLRDVVSEGEARRAARRWIAEAADRAHAQEIATRIINAAGGDIDRAITVLEELRAEEAEQPGTLDFIEALLHARRAQRDGQRFSP